MQSGACSNEPMDRPRNPMRVWIGSYRGERYYLAPGAGETHVDNALVALSRLSEPMPREKIGEHIAKLLVLCSRRSETDADLQLRVAAFADGLALYPADILEDVLTDWPRRNKWFPSLAEIEDAVSSLNDTRMIFRKRLEHIAKEMRGRWPARSR